MNCVCSKRRILSKNTIRRPFSKTLPMKINVIGWNALFLILFTICSFEYLDARPTHYPTIDDELSQLLVQNMGELMNACVDASNPDYPTFTDEHYKARFLEMSGSIQYRFTTDVKNHILHRAERYRSATERTLGLTEMYFPIFEEYLAQKNIPHHLKYLPIVESNLNPVAKSHAAAVGLWQFISGTGKLYGLKITSYLDERSDTHKASAAAATMLSNLYKRYGDWCLALAAYNCGPGRVDKYVKGNNKNFWDIRKYLPRETRMYVPYFMAVTYAYEYAYLHELTPKKVHSDLVLTDTIHLPQGYKSLSQLSKELKIDRDTLKRLNPAYIKNYIPSSSKKSILVLPARIVAKLRNYETAYNRILATQTQNPIKCVRRVSSDADIDLLMRAHRFARRDLLSWNNLPANYRVRSGDLIAVRKYRVPADRDLAPKKEVRKNIESISIASLKVVGLDDRQEKALTAPVYISLKKKKLADKVAVSTTKTPATRKSTIMGIAANSKGNPYALKNKTTAVPAQRAQQERIITAVSEDRSRGRRLRNTVGTTTPTTTIKTTPTEPAPAAKAPVVYQKPQMLAVKSANAAAAAKKAAAAAAERKAAEEARKKAEMEALRKVALEQAAKEAAAKKVEAEKQVKNLSRSIASKEQAVLKAKKYSKTSSEEVATLSFLHQETDKLEKERQDVTKTATKTSAQPAKEIATKDLTKAYKHHTVKYGETLATIAKQYPGTSIQALMTLNNISSTTVLRAGTVLKIQAK